MMQIAASASDLRQLKGSSSEDDDSTADWLVIGLIVCILVAIPGCACLIFILIKKFKKMEDKSVAVTQ